MIRLFEDSSPGLDPVRFAVQLVRLDQGPRPHVLQPLPGPQNLRRPAFRVSVRERPIATKPHQGGDDSTANTLRTAMGKRKRERRPSVWVTMRGAPPRAIQELAGHREPGMTQRYMHLIPAALDSAIRLLDQAPAVKTIGDI
jgi:hypothetical protein